MKYGIIWMHGMFSASESCWRIFGFTMHHNVPSVERLPVHTSEGQMITFNPETQTIEEVMTREDLHITKLTAFFDACLAYPGLTSNLLYPDCPSKLTWKADTKSWAPRQNGRTIGRVYFCPPSGGERFYLRMLLYHIPAPTSFEFLKTHDGVVYDTFQAACSARGYLATDDEWHRCLQEAGLIQTGHQLRQLFASILLNNSPQDPNDLLDRHIDNLSDDCRRRLQQDFHIDAPTLDQIRSLALHEIDAFLHRAGKTLADYHLPSPSIQFDSLNGIPRIIAEEKNYDLAQLNERWQQGYLQANVQQRDILDAITSTVELNRTGLFFIDGPGGTGKTYVENWLLAWVRSTGRIALSIASSGIASILLEGGHTSHSRFKIPIDIHADSICHNATQSDLATLLKMTSLIIWDEAPAQHRHCFQAADRTLRDLHKNSQWFGKITMVFGGMFLIS